MTDFAAFFLDQAQASAHVQFVYDVTASRVVFVNEAYAQVLHGTQAQVNAELPALLARLHPDDQVLLRHYWRLWVRGQMSDEVEVRLRSPGQEPDHWFCLTPSYRQAADGSVLLGGRLTDISVSKRHQANSDKFNTRKNAVLEILAHELSGSFGLVQQLAQLLRQELPAAATSRAADLLAVLETASHDSAQLIRELVNLEFLASANTDLQRTRLEIGTMLHPLLDQLQRAHGLLGQQFTYRLPPEPVYANLDANKFMQVLTNLLSNAFKFTPAGGTVAVHVAAYPGGVRIAVADEGIGIPQALQPHLFERFTPARRPGLRGEPTTGLGLALCQTIVEWHEGTLSCQSTEGQGSTFTVELPQA